VREGRTAAEIRRFQAPAPDPRYGT